MTRRLNLLAPGLGLCFLISVLAYGLAQLELTIFGRIWLESLVLAILLGTGLRSIWKPSPLWQHGIQFSGKYLLEVAVVLLGASVSAATLFQAGLPLLAGVAVLVTGAILLSFGIGKLLRLPTRMALLVACGNSICGNSAIVAVAPVIGAKNEDVAASIAFTAVLGVVVVLSLPLAGVALGMTDIAYGAFAGMTVYAVPQVIAAAAPMGTGAIQMGTLVKLVRVLMLGPVCLSLALISPRLSQAPQMDGGTYADASSGSRRSLSPYIPWFIIGFLSLMAFRSFGLIPTTFIAPIGIVATALTIISMAALGLGVDVRTVYKAGARVTLTACLSLIVLALISLILLLFLGFI